MERGPAAGACPHGEFPGAVPGVSHRSLVLLRRCPRDLQEALRGEAAIRQLLARDAGLFRYGRKEVRRIDGLPA